MQESIEFQVFAKPVGSRCNMNCRYCYYLEKNNLYPGTDKFLMSDEILEKYIAQHMQASKEDPIFFSWHGGEPLLAGIDFYRKAIDFQTSCKPAGKTVINGIQTNGTLINEEWSRFFAEENFMVGISIDGSEQLHNVFRKSSGDKGTFSEVIAGYELLKAHGNNPEILCAISSMNVRYPLVVYEFLKQLKPNYITFIPIVIYEPESLDKVNSISVPALEFGLFLSIIFDEWLEKDIGEIKIQIFEEAFRTAFNQDHTLCIFKKNCGAVPVIEHNGDIYSCDHFVSRDYLLGNINERPLSWYLESERQRKFGISKSACLPSYCRKCEVLSMCNGECPKNRFIYSPDGEPGLNYLCEGYKYFFSHCIPFIDAVSKLHKK